MPLHTQTIGTGFPVVFLHGLGLDMASMQAWYAPLFSHDQIQRIYLDLPGMGASPAVPIDQANSDTILHLIYQTIHQRVGQQDYAVVGHSYGGYLALALAYRDPAVKHAFTTCLAITAVTGERSLAAHYTIQEAAITPATNTQQLADYQRTNVILNPQTWQAYQAQILPGLNRCDRSFIHLLQRQNSRFYRLSFEDHLRTARLSQPITLLLGRADNQVGFQEQLTFGQRQPQGTVSVLARAGHNLPIDQPALLAAYFQQFITSLLH